MKEFKFNFYKDFNLKESKTFCMAPWVHLYSSPSGAAAPCCIASSCNTPNGIGDTKKQDLKSIINSPQMNKLRKDMLTGTMNPECEKCHRHDAQKVLSARYFMNQSMEEFYDEAIENTAPDGSIRDFKMRYFDTRFSNICNFKCRTCGAGFSSQWEQEDLRNNVPYARIYPKNDNPDYFNEIMEQVPNFKIAYFAGGEPLITEEHYILLEEMIRLGKTDVYLRYNTNMSNFKFKNKDILGLWKHFKNGIDIYASIDHYGERAEYIRNGTDWAVVEENLIKARQTPYINLLINTVLSAFNFLSIDLFYQYLIDKNLYSNKDKVYTLYNMSTPEHFTCHMLPEAFKLKGKESIERTIKMMETNNFKQLQIEQVKDALPWAMLYDTWDQHKYAFRAEVKRVDEIRGEDFRKTFPELAPLLDFEKRPVI